MSRDAATPVSRVIPAVCIVMICAGPVGAGAQAACLPKWCNAAKEQLEQAEKWAQSSRQARDMATSAAKAAADQASTAESTATRVEQSVMRLLVEQTASYVQDARRFEAIAIVQHSDAMAILRRAEELLATAETQADRAATEVAAEREAVVERRTEEAKRHADAASDAAAGAQAAILSVRDLTKTVAAIALASRRAVEDARFTARLAAKVSKRQSDADHEVADGSRRANDTSESAGSDAERASDAAASAHIAAANAVAAAGSVKTQTASAKFPFRQIAERMARTADAAAEGAAVAASDAQLAADEAALAAARAATAAAIADTARNSLASRTRAACNLDNQDLVTRANTHFAERCDVEEAYRFAARTERHHQQTATFADRVTEIASAVALAADSATAAAVAPAELPANEAAAAESDAREVLERVRAGAGEYARTARAEADAGAATPGAATELMKLVAAARNATWIAGDARNRANAAAERAAIDVREDAAESAAEHARNAQESAASAEREVSIALALTRRCAVGLDYLDLQYEYARNKRLAYDETLLTGLDYMAIQRIDERVRKMRMKLDRQLDDARLRYETILSEELSLLLAIYADLALEIPQFVTIMKDVVATIERRSTRLRSQLPTLRDEKHREDVVSMIEGHAARAEELSAKISTVMSYVDEAADAADYLRRYVEDTRAFERCVVDEDGVRQRPVLPVKVSSMEEGLDRRYIDLDNETSNETKLSCVALREHRDEWVTLGQEVRGFAAKIADVVAGAKDTRDQHFNRPVDRSDDLVQQRFEHMLEGYDEEIKEVGSMEKLWKSRLAKIGQRTTDISAYWEAKFGDEQNCQEDVRE